MGSDIKQHKGSLLLILGTVLLHGCATTEVEKVSPSDPYESFNRPVHNFNTKVDSFVAKPLADAYKFVTPNFFQTGVRNFFNNLQDVNVVLNDVLQAKFEQSFSDLGRLSMNTTLGLMGVFDVASDVGLEKHNEDFGQTLAVWGMPQGNYLVLPFLGPTTMRELPGYVVDTAANPASYVGVAMPLAGLGLLNARANAEGSLQFINEAALDPYVFTREAFLQWRNYQATDGKVDASKDVMDLEDEVLGDAGAPKGSAKSTSVAPTAGQANNASYNDAKASFLAAEEKLRATKAVEVAMPQTAVTSKSVKSRSLKRKVKAKSSLAPVTTTVVAEPNTLPVPDVNATPKSEAIVASPVDLDAAKKSFLEADAKLRALQAKP